MRALFRRIEVVLATVCIVLVGGLLVYAFWPDGAPSAGGGHGAHDAHQAAGSEVHGDGLSDTHDGFRLVPEQLPAERGDKVPVAFRITGPDGKAVTDYRVNQTKRLHLLVLRDDMHTFQHVHPELDGDIWSTTVDVPDGGLYRIFAEFVPDIGDNPHPVMLGVRFIIPGDTTFVELPAPKAKVKTGGYTVTRPDGLAKPLMEQTSTLRFTVTGADGEPAELEEYLGSYAHISAFNAMTMAASHLHPQQKPGTPLDDGELTVHARFEQRGEHRVFVQFQAGGKVHVAAFTVFVT